MNVLGIESSCDETAAAVVADGRQVMSNVVASQAELHAAYGGVVPEVASRQHLVWIIPVISHALAVAGIGWGAVDAIAVTKGPGLAGSLLVGVNAAKAISLARGLPLVGVNHMEGHLYANWLYGRDPSFPLLCLIVSGGHSDLILMSDHGRYEFLGKTRDDAAGEAFDKVARILGLGYPGGPAIQAAAEQGQSLRVRLPRAWLKQSFDFSFSGLKTAVLRLVEVLRDQGRLVEARSADDDSSPSRGKESSVTLCDIAAGFQEAVVDVLVEKTRRAAEAFGATEVLLAGGVASNSLLRARITEAVPIPVFYPPPVLCTDNAAMIAGCGYFRLRTGQTDTLGMDVFPSLKLG